MEGGGRTGDGGRRRERVRKREVGVWRSVHAEEEEEEAGLEALPS